MQKNKGFTLIELLVVIAIIGILASVVLTSLSSAREKANTAAFKSEVASLTATGVMACDGSAATDTTRLDIPADVFPGTFSKIDLGTAQCTGDGTFSIAVTVLAGANGGTCTGATVTEEGPTFAGC